MYNLYIRETKFYEFVFDRIQFDFVSSEFVVVPILLGFIPILLLLLLLLPPPPPVLILLSNCNRGLLFDIGDMLLLMSLLNLIGDELLDELLDDDVDEDDELICICMGDSIRLLFIFKSEL